MTKKAKSYSTEAEMCADFIAAVDRLYGAQASNRRPGRDEWTAYPETAGFDILLARRSDGLQIGIEAKLALNVDVVHQALPRWSYDAACVGPDYRAVLVPHDATARLAAIIGHLGVTVLRQYPDGPGFAPRTRGDGRKPYFHPGLPTGDEWIQADWHPWCPVKRCELPEFVPDCAAGEPAPLRLTKWKVRAIQLMILLEERPVTRADMKALGLDPSRWTDKFSGWLVPTPEGYVRGERTPDLKAQHPRNWDEIKATRTEWDPAKTGLGLVP